MGKSSDSISQKLRTRRRSKSGGGEVSKAARRAGSASVAHATPLDAESLEYEALVQQASAKFAHDVRVAEIPDVQQEARLGVVLGLRNWLRFRCYGGEARRAAYIYGTVSRRIREYLRSGRKRGYRRLSAPVDVPTETSFPFLAHDDEGGRGFELAAGWRADPAHIAEMRLDAELVLAELDTIDRRARAIFDAALECDGYSEVAIKFGVTASRVSQIVNKVKRDIRERFRGKL